MSASTASIQGSLIFDYGLPAAGVTVRLYDVGFAGRDAKLGETKGDVLGNYTISYQSPPAGAPNLQLRVLDSASKEITLSVTKSRAQAQEVLNLVVPGNIQPLTAEFDRLAADIAPHAGSIGALSQAVEDSTRQDLSLLSQSTGWDARLIALAAHAAQQMTATKLGQDVLYALFRLGLPTDPEQLALVPSTTVQKALEAATKAGIVAIDARQVAAATAAFDSFAVTARLFLTSPGGLSNFHDLLNAPALSDPGWGAPQQTAFANLYFSRNSSGDGLWDAAEALNLPAKTLDALKVQGKLLYLTFNNAPLSDWLHQQIGAANDLSQLAEKDFYKDAAWTTGLTGLAKTGNQSLDQLIPPSYGGQNAAERLTGYAADMARKVRFSFPTQVVARMIENKDLFEGPSHADPKRLAAFAQVPTFLRAAATLGYEIGHTPLNKFLKTHAKKLPAMDQASTDSVKRVHRLYQLTPSNESMQVLMQSDLSSAHDIASHTKDEFMSQYGPNFSTMDEALLVYAKSQQISSVTFNAFTMASHLDTSPPLAALSPSPQARQAAKNAIIEQFPTMESLFGSMDFCECEHCRSVLSPAAYFVDLLEFLSPANAKNPTPLDVLLGRRADLGALPLTCENTNTVMPYIDLVNEILEYYVAHNQLDAGVAYDTGATTTADLTAEPQHVLKTAYDTLEKDAVYPLNLPFDLWTETARGFFNYFQIPLTQILDTLRPVDQLELFDDPAQPQPYYRAQILAESLGLSPAEYGVLTVIAPASGQPDVQHWYRLYGYTDEATALGTSPSSDAPALPSAKTLSRCLGLTYQETTDLVTTGFLNPALNTVMLQFQRFGISLGTAFSYTGQPGSISLSDPDQADFGALLDGITHKYGPPFDAKAWLKSVLPANYSRRMLVLQDPSSGYDFAATTLQYADGSPATPLDFLKLNLFVRLWKKLGWSLDETDRALQLFFPANLPGWSDPGFATAFSTAWKTALVYLAHLDDLNRRFNPALGRVGLLPLWADLPSNGANPLYAQLFLTASVLNGDPAFDDPSGKFPGSTSDLLSDHQPTLQGVLGLTADEITAILGDAAAAVTFAPNAGPNFSLANISILYRYSLLAKCLDLPISDLIAVKALSGLDPFHRPNGAALTALKDNVLFNQTLSFIQQVTAVKSSGFSVEDLQYLLRHRFDPVGQYMQDSNLLMALVQSVASGLRQIQAQNALPVDVTGLSEDFIEQKLSGLLPATILKPLFTLLTDAQTYQASQSGVGNAIDPTPFAEESGLSFAPYDATTQTQSLSYDGVLLDWKKAQLLKLNSTVQFANLLDGVQQQARQALTQRLADIVGTWASLVEYEAVTKGNELDPALAQADTALSLDYDEADQLQRLAYQGVLIDAKKTVLTNLNNSPMLSKLLDDIQHQAMPAYEGLVGTILAMWANIQSYEAEQENVAPGSQIDPAPLAGIPEIQLYYDAASQVQKLTYRGVLTDAERTRLAGLLSGSALLANLLQVARDQAVQFFLTQAAGLLTVTAADLDQFSKPFLQIDDTKKQKRVKEELLRVFLPLLAKKLSRQLILQSLAANLGSEPSLTAALTTDAGLLTDPNRPGKSLLESFLAIGQPGVSASFNGGAAVPATNANVTGQPGTTSAHFAGYLQVPTDGPYRFFAELGDNGAEVTFRLDSPDPTALFPEPILEGTAGSNNAEFSQFIRIRGGVAYHFTLDFAKLGANGASLLIQGENLPRSPLSSVILYPQDAVDGFLRARLLLSKVLQILKGTDIGERELSYLVANADYFSDLKLGALPTQASDDSLVKATPLFTQFLTLADYADLRKGPAGGSDGLVDVFRYVGKLLSNEDPASPWCRLAELTRRDPQTVLDLARYFGLIQPQQAQIEAVGDFGNNKGIRRIWEALQVLQTIGIPVATLTAATLIASKVPPSGSPQPDEIATGLKNAVQARFDPDTWRAVAQSVFDPLRRKKRDALVGYLLQSKSLQLENAEQLFEYFLVDPGMEPVVQTSRLRLAISSVQTFIQRCLLNLENGVMPSAINTDRWEWMKRYRVWEANRKIFLFPENWMQPELRLDKSDLFQALESALLQGDVTRDLVEDAFLTYLKGLDVRAQLDIVATYLEQRTTDAGILHVIGRTYGQPHKYFYRTYSNQSWSAWEAVTPDIGGDHIVCVIWRGKLNLFWLTFLTKGKPPDQVADPDPKPTGVAFLGINDLAKKLAELNPQKQIQLQLNWSEYFQGKWSDPISTDPTRYDAIDVPDAFDPRYVHVHVSKEVDASGNEGAVKIHLHISLYNLISHAFRVTSKNSSPDFSHLYWEMDPPNPYNTDGIDATLLTGSKFLKADFKTDIVGSGIGKTDPQMILQSVGNYALLPCANPVVPPLLDPNEPDYQEAGSLVSPFFFKDTATAGNAKAALANLVQPPLNFFVQPSLTETAVPFWLLWAVPLPVSDWCLIDPNQINIVAQVPSIPNLVHPGDPGPSLYPMKSLTDWLSGPQTVISYQQSQIGQAGAIDPGAISALSSAQTRSAMAGLAAGSAQLVVIDGAGLKLSQLGTLSASHLTA